MLVKNVVAKYIRGRRCILCNNTQLYKLPNRYIKCKACKHKYSLKKLSKDLSILYHFYLEISARKTSIALEIPYKSVSSRFMQYRYKIAYYLREQFKKLGGEVEIDESCLEVNVKEKEAEERITKQLYSAYWK